MSSAFCTKSILIKKSFDQKMIFVITNTNFVFSEIICKRFCAEYFRAILSSVFIWQRDCKEVTAKFISVL